MKDKNSDSERSSQEKITKYKYVVSVKTSREKFLQQESKQKDTKGEF